MNYLLNKENIYHYDSYPLPLNVADKEPCLRIQCLNGGRCIEKNETKTYTCTCPDGWTGDRCQYGKTST